MCSRDAYRAVCAQCGAQIRQATDASEITADAVLVHRTCASRYRKARSVARSEIELTHQAGPAQGTRASQRRITTVFQGQLPPPRRQKQRDRDSGTLEGAAHPTQVDVLHDLTNVAASAAAMASTSADPPGN